jgi:cbb3-type cytochrome oxidase maturation protein
MLPTKNCDMNIIILLISISLIIATGFLVAFMWNLRSGQYDDTYSPSVRMLFDDKPVKQRKKPSNVSKDSCSEEDSISG